MPTLFLLEDDAALADGLTYALRREGYAVTAARTVADARACLAQRRFDLLVLDVTLPDGTGYELCQTLRAAGDTTPLLFLTAADEEIDIIRGLDCGGDDYLTKPFRLGELFGRLRALLRRAGTGREGAVLHSGPLTIDLPACRAAMDGRTLELTAAEYRLLCLLVRHAGQTLTRQAILDDLWDGSGEYVDDNTLSVYMRRLREKVEPDPARPQYLLTVRGFGYRWQGGAL